jgi:hypothetical protein
MLLVCIGPSSLYADIYMWTDENGVKHYSNTAPSQDAEVTEEIQDNNASKTMDIRQRRGPQQHIRKRRTTGREPPGLDLHEPVQGSGVPETVRDPSVAAAINGFNAEMEAIESKCNQGTDRRACMCDHMSEIIKANQAKIDAFQSLMRRRPELINQMVKIEGVFGYWHLDPNDPAIQKRNDLNFWRNRYNCK